MTGIKFRFVSNISRQAGFSLAEVLVTITVLVIIGIFISLVLSGTFTGNTKTDLISTIKQNGQNALSQMEKDIRDSATVVCPQTTTVTPVSVITVQSQTEGVYTRYSYFAQVGTTANGYLQKETFVFPSPPQDANFYTDMCNTTAVTYDSYRKTRIDLTDRTSRAAVSVKNVSGTGFSLTRKAGSKDIITVQFDLGPAINASGGFESNVGSSSNSFNFKTTIQLR